MHAHEPEIVSIRADLLGVYVTLICPGCRSHFDSPQAMVAGVPLGEHTCPGCALATIVPPQVFFAAVERRYDTSNLERLVQISEEATRVTESWHRDARIARLLEHRGVDLASPTERELMPLVTEGLLDRSGAGRAR